MGFLDFLKSPNIDQGIKEFERTPGAVLLDVRAPQEYEHRRIPGSVNLPLQNIDRAGEFIPSKDTPVFVYCYSGGRSHQAVNTLKRMGYSAVTDLGGINSYSGKVALGPNM